MILLAGFKALLSRTSGQTDICVGTAAAGRTQPEVEPLIGLFVNSLVLRTDLSGDPSFTELVRRVRRTSLEAYAHGDVPFDRLVEHLGIARERSRPPLFQAMFSMHAARLPELTLEGLAVTPLAIEQRTSKLDLTLEMTWDGERLLGVFEYSVALFDAGSIARLAAHVVGLLASAASDPAARLSGLQLGPATAPGELEEGEL
jgi:non-ribosomal peptide synthetase component F